MAEETAAAIIRLGWRQGSVLGPLLVSEAIRLKPDRLTIAETDCLIVTSHDCDTARTRLGVARFVDTTNVHGTSCCCFGVPADGMAWVPQRVPGVGEGWFSSENKELPSPAALCAPRCPASGFSGSMGQGGP